MTPSTCPLCRRIDPITESATPTHLATTAVCWAHYRRTVAREYRDPERWTLRGLTRDAYGAQHAGGRSRSAVAATGVHLIGLSLALDRGLDAEGVGTVRAAAVDRLSEGLSWLEPPTSVVEPSIQQVAEAEDIDQYSELVQRWAAEVWAAWAPHHPTVRRWIDWLYAASPPHLVGRDPTL